MCLLTDEVLDCSHLNELAPLIRRLGSPVSEYSFSNLFLFRKQHDYKLLRCSGFIFLQGVTYDGVRYLMPFVPLTEIGLPTLKELMSCGFSLFPIPEGELGIFDDTFTVTSNENDSDYIYKREKIELLPGRYLHKKRNLIKQYRTLYKHRQTEFTSNLANDAIKVLDEWFLLGGQPAEKTDYTSCSEAVKYFDCLNLSGMIFYANDAPAGFLLGEELNEYMYVIHFAKGNTNFKGIYPHMYNAFAAELPKNYTLLNFEQDLGKETLRQAKSTYLADDMLIKYRVSL
jgi:hypothetical protein